MIAGNGIAEVDARGVRHSRRTTGGPTAVGPSRRRHPRGTCSPHRCFGPLLTPSGWSWSCLRLRASPGAPPPASLADGPLVARGALSAPRSWVRGDRPAIEALPPRNNVAGGPWVVSYSRTPSCRSVADAPDLSFGPVSVPGEQQGADGLPRATRWPTARDAGGGAPGLARSRRHLQDLPEGVRRGPKQRCGEHVPRGCRRREGPTADGHPVVRRRCPPPCVLQSAYLDPAAPR